MTFQSRMLARLPLLYQEGHLVTGLLDHLALQLEISERDLGHVHKSHFFGTADHRKDVNRLAALLGLAGESWMNVDQIKAWVRAIRQALFHHGAVTPTALLTFVRTYTRELQNRPDSPQWISHGDRLGLINQGARFGLEEQPGIRRYLSINSPGAEPLTPFEVVHQGLDPSHLSLFFLANDEIANPLIINETSRQFIALRGTLKAGQRLWIGTHSDGSLYANLEQRNVADQLMSGSVQLDDDDRLHPQIDPIPQPFTLLPGENILRFFPIAITQAPGLSRVLLGFPGTAMQQIRLDESQFDRAIFYSESQVALSLSWLEGCRAAFRICLDSAKMRFPQGKGPQAMRGRAQLLTGLRQGLETLKGAGIRGWIEPKVFREIQPQRDFLTQTLPLRFSEGGSVGGDRLARREGSFGLSGFDEATLT